MNKIKLLIITDEMEIGGTQRQIVHLLNNINRDEFEPHLVYFRNSSFLVDELLDNNIPVVNIKKNHNIDLLFIYYLYRYIYVNDFDIVHCFALSAEFWGTLCFYLMRKGHLVTSIRSQYEWYTPLQWKLKKSISKSSAKVITNSKNTGDYSYSRMNLLPTNLHVIYNGIDFNSNAISEHLDVDNILVDYKYVIMFIGRLVDHKNIPTLIKAFKNVLDQDINDICLIMVGDGPDYDEIQLLINESKVNHVHFIGERSDVRDLLDRADVVISPSYREGLSNTILEAMEAGVPVIASSVGGTPEIITDKETGILFHCDDVDELSDAILKVYNDKQYSEKLGKSAREEIHTRFSIPTMVKNFENTYKSIVNS